MNQTIRKRIEDINSGIVPEGYKQTPFGIFPCDWEAKSMNQICDIYSGGTPSTKKEEYWDGDIPWCCPTDITKSNKYIKKTERNISRQGLENSSATLMPINSILMCSRATIGPRCINKVPMATNQGFKNLLCKNKNDTEFVYYLLEQLVANFLKTSSGSTFLELSKSELEKAEYYLSKSEVERNKIAEILMKWDEMIELQEQYIQKLELRKKAVVQQLLLNNDGWIETPLTKVIKERKKYAVLDSEYPHVTLGKSGVVDKTEQYERDFLVKSEDKEYKITYPNDIAYNPANLKFGVICVNKYPVPAIFSPIYVTFEVNDKYNVDFVGAVLCSENFVQYIRKYEEGSLYERQAVKPEDFLKGRILIPERKIQDYIADVIRLADEEISLQKEKLEKIKIQRKAMQQYLLTGIVRVS